MPTPLFDALHLQFARQVHDPVTWTVGNAGVDGKVYSILNRTDYLNRANKILQFQKFQKFGRDGVREQLQSLVATQTLTFSSAGIAVEAAYNNIPLAVSKTSSTNLYRYWPRQEEITLNLNPDLPYLFTVVNNTLYVYESGVLIPTGNTGTFYYIKKDEVAQNHATVDIALPAVFYDELVEIAVGLATKETQRPTSG